MSGQTKPMLIPSNAAKEGRSGLTRRLARVMFLQLIFISIITVLGVIFAAKVVEGTMISEALEGEAAHYWAELDRDPQHALPNTDNLRGFLSRGDNFESIPAELKSLPPGYEKVDMGDTRMMVYIDRKTLNGQPTTLYLVFDEENVKKLSFYFGVVPLSIVLIIIYLSAWVGFRQSRKAVSPLVALANRLRRFQPAQSQLVDLELENLKTASIDDEINVLVDSLNSFTDEINHFIERERRFTRDASHELRTPLTVIQGSAEFLLNNPDLSAHQKRAIDRILRTGRDMNELVTALLLLARGSKTLPNVTEVDMQEVVEKQLAQLKITHNADSHVNVTVDFRKPAKVIGTSQLVEAVVGNLLRNAFNYTRKGEVSVVINDNVLEVCNRGEGVTAGAGDQLFEPFVRGSSSQGVSGYGVGLDIVKRLCELFEWQIESEFSVERGMIFRLQF
ncbi:MAG: HAMP domain-containing histidine kinase [Acidiferrobacterales bacterium]|nr:HAMP domain-containing histidine kinase [Acidiferrobacterales bacterium]